MNCLSYALDKWKNDGGYLLVRRSHFARDFGIESKWHPVYWVPHFLHRSNAGVVTQYSPTQAQRERFKRRGPWSVVIQVLFHFEGEVVGDDVAEPIDAEPTR